MTEICETTHPTSANVSGRRLAPAVGAVFEYKGSSYRCDAWLCPAEPPAPEPGWNAVIDAILFESAFQRNGVRFRYCLRHEATHVAGSGVCGCLADIELIQVTGRVDWPEAMLRDAEAAAERRGRAGEIVM